LKKIIIFFIILANFLILGCENKKNISNEKVIISEKFIGNDSYYVVCRGLPNENLSKIVKIESAKEAALLNVEFHIKNKFNNKIDPVKDGIIDKYEISGDSVLIYYSIKRKNIKNLLKK